MTTKIQHQNHIVAVANHEHARATTTSTEHGARGVAELFAADSLTGASARAKHRAHKTRRPGAHHENAGGAVIKHPNVAPLYLGKHWNTSTGQADRAYFDAFTKDLAGNSSYAGVLAQYGVKQASASPSSTLMPDAAPHQ